MTDPIRVLLVDGCEPLRIGIRRAFARANKKGGGGVQIIGEARNGAYALAALNASKPQIVLIDGRLSDLNGYEVIASARLRGSAARFVAYSAYEEYEDVMGFVRAGAAGYIVKDESVENLIHGIKTAARGGVWYSCQISPKLHIPSSAKLYHLKLLFCE